MSPAEEEEREKEWRAVCESLSVLHLPKRWMRARMPTRPLPREPSVTVEQLVRVYEEVAWVLSSAPRAVGAVSGICVSSAPRAVGAVGGICGPCDEGEEERETEEEGKNEEEEKNKKKRRTKKKRRRRKGSARGARVGQKGKTTHYGLR